jgi:phenylalanine-4-hydroxylase
VVVSQLVILSLDDCTVTHGTEILFKPEWGTFDLACGERVVSVFGGAADRRAYVAKTGGFKQTPMKPKTNLTSENRRLNEIYSEIRKLRESGRRMESDYEKLAAELDRDYGNDWLSRLEIIELVPKNSDLSEKLRNRLAAIRKLSRDRDEMIGRGLALI